MAVVVVVVVAAGVVKVAVIGTRAIDIRHSAL
jgi:hypothetical protein